MKKKLLNKKITFGIFSAIIIFFTFCFHVHHVFEDEKETVTHDKKSRQTRIPLIAGSSKGVSKNIPLAIIICRNNGDVQIMNPGDKRLTWQRQKEQFRTTLGSMLYFSNVTQFQVFVFSDSLETYSEILMTLDAWPYHQRVRLNLEYRDLETEKLTRENLQQWRPCAWGKMFLPEILVDYDSLIYIDSDIIFLGPVEDSWSVFGRMTDKQVIAAAPELWYIEEGRMRPIAGTYGINTGVLILNLTRIRSTFYNGLGETLQRIPKLNPPARHDQDVLNAYLKEKPDLLHELSARYNFLPSSCLKYAPVCHDCLERGILALHGADSSFYRPVDFKSRAVYRVLQDASQTLTTPMTTLAARLEETLDSINQQTTRLLFMCQHYDEYDRQLLHHVRQLARAEEQ